MMSLVFCLFTQVSDSGPHALLFMTSEAVADQQGIVSYAVVAISVTMVLNRLSGTNP